MPNTIQKIKDRAPRTSLKHGMTAGAPERWAVY